MAPRKKASISRGAAGLPRYYMDCGWYRHPNFAGLPLDSLALFEAMIGYSCEHATDGRLPGHHEDLAAALGLRSSAVKKALGPLIERRRVTAEPDHYQVVGYSSHNPTADEIDAFIEERSRSGAQGNHIRHHVNKGKWSDECEFCPDEDPRSSDPSSDRSSDPIAVANGSHGLGGVGLGTSSSPPPSPIAGPTEKVNPEEDQPPNPDTPEARTQAAIEHMARCDLRAQGTTVKHPDSWLAKAVATRTAQLGRQILEDAHEHPDASPVDLAERADPACGPDDGGLARALASAAKVDQDAADTAQFRADRARAKEILASLEPDQRAHLEGLVDAKIDPATVTFPAAARAVRQSHLEALALEHHGTTA